jgi:hypothetical protein
MKSKAIAGIAVLFLCGLLIGIINGETSFQVSEKSREQEWLEDLDMLAEQLPQKHKNLFFKISQTEFHTKLEKLEESIPELEDDEIKVELMKVLASVGDSHTQMILHSARIFPVKFYCFKEGIHVIYTTKDYQAILHQKLIGVEDMDVEAAIQRLSSVTAYENQSQLKHRLPNLLFRTDILYGLHIIQDKEKARFVFADRNQKRTERTIFSMSVKENPEPIGLPHNRPLPLYMRNANKFFWVEYLDKEQTLYFKYNACRNMSGLTVQKFTEDLLEFMESHPILRLVVDLRNNGGGNSNLLMPFITRLKERKQINQKGRLYVVVGRQTFSSAVLNALAFQNVTEAVFVGEPTGGKPNHFGEVKGFMLKNSKIGIQYSTKYFTHSKEDTSSFNPDVLIEPSIRDYLEYRDPVLEYILDHELEPDRNEDTG